VSRPDFSKLGGCAVVFFECSIVFGQRQGRAQCIVRALVLGAIVIWQVGTVPLAAAAAKKKVNPKDAQTYVWIPLGQFQMGCSPSDVDCTDGEKPAHSVTLTKGFWIGQTPVTQAAYKKVMGSNPSFFKGDQLPVDTVTWDDAQAYCKNIDMRLPTEAEWEYAARGGNPSARYGPVADIAWSIEQSAGTTHQVAQKKPNAYGLYDMLGNVWEWVADWYGPYDAAAAVDPQGPQTGQSHLLRGGSWLYDASVVRVSYRYNYVGQDRDYLDGFRCASN
jgi:formylglycine-generating enzyme required for sulfatase activity